MSQSRRACLLKSHLHKWLLRVLTLTQQGIWAKGPNYQCCCWKSEAGPWRTAAVQTLAESTECLNVWSLYACLCVPAHHQLHEGCCRKPHRQEARLTLSSGPNWKQTLETKPCWGTWVSQLLHKGQWGTMTSHCQGGGLELVRVGTHELGIKKIKKILTHMTPMSTECLPSTANDLLTIMYFNL